MQKPEDRPKSDLGMAIFDTKGRSGLIVLGALLLIVILTLWSIKRPKKVEFYELKTSNLADQTEPKEIVVYVCGAVNLEGVYSCAQGDRVNDALKIAGGATKEADLKSLNLAAKLVDGQKLYVPPIGENQASEPLKGASLSGGGYIGINTASSAELETLTGIGPTLAMRIVDHREKNGPFQSIDGLLEVEGIGKKKLDSIKDEVILD